MIGAIERPGLSRLRLLDEVRDLVERSGPAEFERRGRQGFGLRASLLGILAKLERVDVERRGEFSLPRLLGRVFELLREHDLESVQPIVELLVPVERGDAVVHCPEIGMEAVENLLHAGSFFRSTTASSPVFTFSLSEPGLLGTRACGTFAFMKATSSAMFTRAAAIAESRSTGSHPSCSAMASRSKIRSRNGRVQSTILQRTLPSLKRQELPERIRG